MPDQTPEHLTEMVTQWSQLFRAKESQGDRAAEARRDLLVRYHEAVYNYLRSALRDPHAVDKIFSNFAVRVLELDKFLQRADPNRGRFRDYLKTILRHMIMDHFREQQRERKRQEPFIEGGEAEPAESYTAEGEDERFVQWWRQEVINQAWKALDELERETGQPYAAVLHYQTDHPGARSAQIAEHLSNQRGKPVTPAGVRQLVHRAREHFGDLLVHEVARSLQADAETKVQAAQIEDELIELNLLFSYCKDALGRYAHKHK
jgi:RNA polymerase sigma factor (sigma-70 family)